MSEEKKSVYESLRGIFGGFILSIVLFCKGVLTALFFAWIISRIPFLASLIGIAENNHAAQIVMIAGDISSVIYALISFWNDLKLAFRS